MSTFDGRIREYPAVAIDNFEPNDFAKYFILSHVHSGNHTNKHCPSVDFFTNTHNPKQTI